MTATVNFESPQLKVDNGTNGIEISQVILPYSIRNAEDSSQYLGGQTVLTQEDGIALTDNTADWYKKALVKIKDMVAASEIYTPDVAPVVDTTDVSTEEAQSTDVEPLAQVADAPNVAQTTQDTTTYDVTTPTQGE
nr:MAG TPA: hypothetical protein [Caudoviricetes sp.]